MEKQNRWSFWNGWHSVPQERHAELAAELMAELGLKWEGLRQRRAGKYEPRASEKEKIERVFKENFNTPLYKIWGGTRKGFQTN